MKEVSRVGAIANDRFSDLSAACGELQLVLTHGVSLGVSNVFLFLRREDILSSWEIDVSTLIQSTSRDERKIHQRERDDSFLFVPSTSIK